MKTFSGTLLVALALSLLYLTVMDDGGNSGPVAMYISHQKPYKITDRKSEVANKSENLLNRDVLPSAGPDVAEDGHLVQRRPIDSDNLDEQYDQPVTDYSDVHALYQSGARKMVVDITPEQHEIFLVMEAKIADPFYASTLKLNDLVQSDELQSLPDALRLALVSKAIAQYNLGNISRDTFYSVAEQ